MNTKEKVINLVKQDPFMAVFIGQCAQNVAEDILKDKEAFIKEHTGEVVAPETWVDCAERVVKLLKE